jgi:hypothetical protein
MSNSLELRDLVTLVQAIEHHKGKHLKSTLLLLERAGKLDPVTRKIVLDGFNNFNRQVLRLLDYNVEN